MPSIIEQNQATLPIPNYTYVTNEDEARKAMSFLNNYPIHAIDTETTALDPYEAKWTLLQVGVTNKVFVFDVRHDTEHSSLHPEVLDPLLTDPTKMRILQNAAYDMKIIKRSRGYYLTNIYDTMLVEQLSTLGLPFTKASLAAIVLKHLGLYMPKEPRTTFSDYGQKYEDFQLIYAANDVTPLHLIRDLQWSTVIKEGLENAARLEFEFIKPLCEMELNGIHIDTEKWRIIMKDVEKERIEVGGIIRNILAKVEDQNTLFGVSLVNIDSNAQLKKSLVKYGLNIEKTDFASLEKHAGLPIIDAILDYRKANKLISTYSETLLAKISKYTGRLHTDFRQMVSTGRMSSSNPNLQNIPKKQKFRSCFVAAPGYKLLTADMSGAELRILGNLSQDPVFIDAYATGQDLHTRTSSEIFDVVYDRVEKNMRNAAKAINFGLCTTEDTNIITNHGIKIIKDIKLGEEVAHDIGKNIVIDKQYMGEKEVFEIITKYGYSMEVTEDHLVKVVNYLGEYVDTKLKNLDITKDSICIKKGSNLFPKNDVYFDNFETYKNTNYKTLVLPKKLTIEWAAFLGLFIAEGCVIKVRNRETYSVVSFGFSKSDKEFIHKIDTLLYNLFGNRVSKPNDKYDRYSINSILFSEWLVNILNIKNIDKTKEISIPKCIKESKMEYQIEFLKWLFEGDGTIKSRGNSYVIQYSSKSKILVKDIQLMLLNFGILSSITSENRNGYPDKYYCLSIVSNEGSFTFMDQIGFLTNRKNNLAINKNIYNSSAYFINSNVDRMKNIMSNRNTSKQLKDRFYSSRYSDHVGNVYFKELSEYDDFFNLIYKNGIVPLPIESITSKGIKKVYDLSIENHQYFLANGFIVHNCYGMSSMGLSKRLKIGKRESEILINKYFNRYKGVKKYLDKAGHDAVVNRYSTTVSGRKRYYNMPEFSHPDRKMIQSGIERQGMNAAIQGCLVAGSVISGLGSIEDLVEKRFDIETGFGKDSAIGVYSGKKEVYDLRLSNGSVIGITSEHVIPTINNNGNFINKKSIELSDEDFLFVPLNMVEGKPTNLSGYKYIKGHWRETFVNFVLPEVMTEDLSFIIGCLLGDGSYSKHNHINFCCSEHQIELFNKFNTCIEKIFGYKPIIRKQTKDRKIPLYSSQVSSVVIRGFLKHIELDYVINRDKKIPNYFNTETVTNKGALLNGLFSTDGGIGNNSGPSFTSTSKYIANGVHQLLFSIGINSNLKEYTNEYGKVYRLQIPKRFNDKFIKYIGFSITIKQNKLIESGSVAKCGDDSVVPKFIPKLIAGVLIKDPNYSKNFTIQEKAHLKMFKQGKCSYSSWRRFYKKMPECTEKKELSKYIDFDFCKLRSFTYRSIEDTYDVMCDNIHYFITNGIILHNSNADTIKESMILLVERLKGYDARLILTVHDEVVVEAREDIVEEIAPIVSQSLIDGFGKYFSLIPMESSTLVGPCWLKGACEERLSSGEKCEHLTMKFVFDEKYGSKLVCSKCGGGQE